jgi:periplasmic divalent cation tolerance protein
MMKDPNGIRVVFVTFPSRKVAQEIANTLVQEKLVGCVNFWSGESCYSWQEKTENSAEFFALIKTQKDKLVQLKSRFHELHPYEVPSWVELSPDSVSELYSAWLSKVLA